MNTKEQDVIVDELDDISTEVGALLDRLKNLPKESLKNDVTGLINAVTSDLSYAEDSLEDAIELIEWP